MHTNESVDNNRGDQIMAYLWTYSLREGWMPTVREIADGCEIPGTGQVDYWLTKLEKAGKIARKPGHARCIRILEAPF